MKFLGVHVLKQESRPSLEGGEVSYSLIQGANHNWEGWVSTDALLDAPASDAAEEEVTKLKQELEETRTKLTQAETDRDTALTDVGERDAEIKRLQEVKETVVKPGADDLKV